MFVGQRFAELLKLDARRGTGAGAQGFGHLPLGQAGVLVQEVRGQIEEHRPPRGAPCRTMVNRTLGLDRKGRALAEASPPGPTNPPKVIYVLRSDPNSHAPSGAG